MFYYNFLLDGSIPKQQQQQQHQTNEKIYRKAENFWIDVNLVDRIFLFEYIVP